jgi:transposase
MHRLPEGWIAPPATRDLNELVRHRAKLVHLRTSLRQQIHALLAANGIAIAVSDLFGVAGNQLLDRAPLSPAAWTPVISLRHLLDVLDVEIDGFTKLTKKRHVLLLPHRV